MENPNVFAGAFLERSGERRKDSDWLLEAAASEKARFLPVWGERSLVTGEPVRVVLLRREQVEDFVVDDELIFLGNFRGHPAFAVAVNGDEPPFGKLGEFRDLRFLGTVLPLDEANLVAHARALVLWHASQVFCGICGTVAKPGAGGNSRICTNEDCGREIFPRVDPAIIVIVADGDRCLLGRQANWPEGRYSTIAGYHGSQPWPFPASLMIGFFAEAESTEIALNDGELEDARWFTRTELTNENHRLPFRISIARRLVDDWIALGDSP